MRTHPARLSEAGISPARYAELRAICRQYGEARRQLALARAGVVDRPARRSGKWRRPDPTGNAAIAIADHPAQRRVAVIERCAHRVAEPTVAGAILKSVSEGIPYGKLYRRPPIGERQFNVLRLLFYIELDRELWDA